MALRRAINTEVVLGVTTGDENTSPQLLDDDVSATGSPRAPSRRGARVPCVAGHIARARESPDVRMNPPSRAALSRLASAARSAGTRGPRSSLAFATPPSGAHPAPRIPNPRLGVSYDRRGFAAAAASAPNAPAVPVPKSNSWLGAALLLSPSLVCAFLCKWQVDRHHWKKGELAAREAALSAPELTLRELIALVDRGDPPPEYARVHVEGELDVARSVRVAPRTRSVHGSPMPGGILITPLAPRRRGGRAVLVNRGWVPADWEEPRGGACVRTSGVVRVSETPSRFTPHNVDGRWHWIDAPAIAVAAGLPPNTPMVQLVHGGEADRGNAAPTSFPAPVALADLRKFRVDPGDHINYAATWGGLAAATGAGAAWALAGRGGGGTAAAAAARRVGSGASPHTGRGR